MILTKEILPAGTYKVRSNGKRVPKLFDESYLKKIADTSNKMIRDGLKIPTPFDHNKEAVPRSEKDIEENKGSSSYINAGYWKSFWVAPNDEGKPTLFGKVDIPGDEKDESSSLYKAKNTATETSISLAESFEDGIGRTWTDGLLHVALVNHAVVPDQEPFSESQTVVNLSMLMSSHEDDTSLIEELKAALRKIKINLPGSTDSKSFLRDLLVAVSQVGESTPERLEPAPIYMSIGDDMPLTQTQAEALVKAGAINPDTKQPFTMLDLGFKPEEKKSVDMSTLSKELADKDTAIKGLTKMVDALRQKFQADKQASIQQRISSLLNKKVITKEFAESALIPKVTFEMSLTAMDDHPLEVTLSALEALPVNSGTSTSTGVAGNIEPNPYLEGVSDMTNEEMEKALDAMAAEGII